MRLCRKLFPGAVPIHSSTDRPGSAAEDSTTRQNDHRTAILPTRSSSESFLSNDLRITTPCSDRVHPHQRIHQGISTRQRLLRSTWTTISWQPRSCQIQRSRTIQEMGQDLWRCISDTAWQCTGDCCEQRGSGQKDLWAEQPEFE